MKAPTTMSKPAKFACLLPPMECGKETFFSPGTISSTLHQVKFNCFRFLESLGISPAGGGAKRKSWKIRLCLIHCTLEVYPSPLCCWLCGKSQPGEPLKKLQEEGSYKGKDLPGALLERGKWTLQAVPYASIATISQTTGISNSSFGGTCLSS